uniref:Cysteine-rich receptor-like protein kinase 3 n=1 Tax=Noccaea caerulescens TaxID=107243 RepID=A0A1J3GF30_NOCCA
MPIFISSFSLSSLHLLTLYLLGLLLNPAVSDSRGDTVSQICSNRTTPPQQRSLFVRSFLDAMDSISPLVESKGYGQVFNGTGNLTVYAYGECMKDLDKRDCALCFAQIKAKVPRCLPFQLGRRGGQVFSDGCYIRYGDYNFFNQTLSPTDETICATKEITGVNRTLFRDNAAELVRNMSVEAVRNGGFYAGFVDRRNVTVHGLAQCWEPLSRSGCVECLSNASRKIGSCLVREEGRVLNAGCYMRFSTQKFYNNSGNSTSDGNGGGRNRLAVILAVTSSVVAFVLLVSAAAFLLKKKRAKNQREKKQLGSLFMLANKSDLCFSYENLEKATDYFSDKNKLGQGGSGSVFKGVLTNGKTVAVKRLFFNTKQWVDHFFNEVNLISQIEHKNLVKLLGCSITGPESLLVYEYIANQSLHDYLFVRKDVQPLNWAKRFKILLGTAEGLAYLHEESNLRIIHRDIKLSNILLEHDFTAKIADFGLARLFPEDKTHISTAIAGTLGYMAPEYVVRGKLTEKADVYSFGVLMIEVITGRRNNAFSQDSSSILNTVWSLYGTSNLAEIVDPVLGDNFNQIEASRLLQIGLLCVQAAFDQRPAMSAVVKMMIENLEIPTPTQPPFLNPGSVVEMRKMMSPTTDYPQQDQSQSSGSMSNNISDSFFEPR